MKFVQLNFPTSLLWAEGKRNSFYEDTQPTEQYEAVGFVQSHEAAGASGQGRRTPALGMPVEPAD